MDIPPFRHLTEEDILALEKKIVKARNEQKRTFSAIGKEYDLSKEKTISIYNMHYHKKVLTAFKRIQPTVNFSISNYVFNYSSNYYKRWELILNQYAEFVQDLLD